ncbi:MAG: iron-containing alcohol dehydrogenase [Clostridiales Family XIII bacterium]|jgi:alcohol dehydrogenase class IV|nr:iron-containing alcohol dehydrogenase [Clostridiales Family XIII bacterium]
MISYHKQVAPFLFGAGAVGQLYEKLKELGATKALICTDKGVMAAGVVDQAIASLKENDFPYVIFDACLPDAPDTSFYGAADLARREGADAIVAVGGGSDMDTAKVASLLIKERVELDVLLPPGPPGPPTKPDVSLVMIPTTCGTGSEETAVGVVSKSATGAKFGKFITGMDLSIVDPELTLGLPPGLTASTGMDVVAHVCEAYTTLERKNPVSDQRALCVINLVKKWLPIAVKDGGNLEARTNMSLACVITGMCFNDSMTNYAHGIAHAFGTKSHLAHSLGCALAEPPALEALAMGIPDLIRDLGKQFDAEIPESASPEEIGKITGDRLRAFMKEIGIPSLKALGFSRESVMAHLDGVLVEPQVWLAPIEVTAEIAEKTLASMYDDYQ